MPCFVFSLSSPLFFYGGMSYPSSATGSCVSAATSPVGTRAHAALLFVHHMLAVPACSPRLSTLFKPGEGVILFWFNREKGGIRIFLLLFFSTWTLLSEQI